MKKLLFFVFLVSSLLCHASQQRSVTLEEQFVHAWKNQDLQALENVLAKENYYTHNFEYKRGSKSQLVNQVNAQGIPLFIEAIDKENLKLIELFVRFGVDINAQDEQGNTVLHHIVYRYNTIEHEGLHTFETLYSSTYYDKLLDLLGVYGVNFHIKNNQGLTPLHVAVSSSPDNCKKILAMSVNPNMADNSGKTPLHYVATARFYNSAKTLHVLLEHRKINVDAQDQTGKTPLHYAALNNLSSYYIKLIEERADETILDAEGKTPYDYADEGMKKHIKNLEFEKENRKRKLDPNYTNENMRRNQHTCNNEDGYASPN